MRKLYYNFHYGIKLYEQHHLRLHKSWKQFLKGLLSGQIMGNNVQIDNSSKFVNI